MSAHAVFDLHCDTLTAFLDEQEQEELFAALVDPARQVQAAERLASEVGNRDSLDDPRRHFSLSQVPKEVCWAQCCAIFVPDGLNQEESVRYYSLHQQSFVRQMAQFSSLVLPCLNGSDVERAWAQGKIAAILTVENGSALAGRLERVAQLARDGVRMLTLTWNGENELGSGFVSDHGLTSFGRSAVPELERQGILVDVSHLNDRGFWDVMELAEKPLAASHSNARAQCPCSRNLTDDQIRALVDHRCLIGLNFYNIFLRDDGRAATLDDLYRHTSHFLELGAQHCLALGSDADGSEIPPCLAGPDKAAALFDYFLARGLSHDLTEAILWKNALNFFKKNLG